MARYAIGDIQGCYDELRALLRALRFSSDRDELWFVGDLVNRGPKSLEVLRFVRDLGGNAVTVLGNHDLHLLAVAFGHGSRRLRRGDTLDAVLEASDREQLLEWLLAQPLAHHDADRGDLLVHAGLVPQWRAVDAVRLAREVGAALAADAPAVFAGMYGNQPDTWDENLEGMARLRFIINALTRLRFCTPGGRMDLAEKAAPGDVAPPLAPWFSYGSARTRGARVICGHWSALGYSDSNGVIAIDTGCVWGGALTALSLDDPQRLPLQVACGAYQRIGAD
ncbi:MAG TPA: symmetrical bis(5'-nucleosyl)-tetraphosphatase [Steroidobacteraceae bacterium]|jgi:bis(5'-nucleosyl)-tetraphosphatase (symmetrical)|nr:symmetrical bis(5'-nucleosyl)-tetraphosphatase [Steroidobacteraceae bacterium]HNS28072.1 symmetrical bis(5'-nucleosyl)-tetraphosphatase [Steroidobacteraceae bacterium]